MWVCPGMSSHTQSCLDMLWVSNSSQWQISWVSGTQKCFFYNLIHKISNYGRKCGLSNQSAGIYDDQYLWKETVKVLDFLQRDSYQRKITSKNYWLGAARCVQPRPDLPRLVKSAIFLERIDELVCFFTCLKIKNLCKDFRVGKFFVNGHDHSVDRTLKVVISQEWIDENKLRETKVSFGVSVLKTGMVTQILKF